MKLKLLLSIILILILSIFFVFQINFIAAETKLIQIYEEKLDEIQQENEILVVNSNKINSLDNIKEQVELFGFERIENVHHIKLLGDVVVAR